jgi:hypothetical protein
MSHKLRNGVLIAGLMIGVSLAPTVLHQMGLMPADHGETSVRGFNAALGILEVGYASAAAKQLRRLTDIGDLAAEQSLRRFVAWVLVIGGLLYSTIWLAAPYDLAADLSIGALGSAVAIAVGRCLMVRAQRRGAR